MALTLEIRLAANFIILLLSMQDPNARVAAQEQSVTEGVTGSPIISLRITNLTEGGTRGIAVCEIDSGNRTTEVIIGNSPVPPLSTANRMIKEGLSNVKVSRDDATKNERMFRNQLFSRWHERTEITQASRIDIANIGHYIDHLHDAYDGVDENVARNLREIHWDGEWRYKIEELYFFEKSQFEPGDSSQAKYGMIVFGKSLDGMFVSCLYFQYMVDFELLPPRIIHTTFYTPLYSIISRIFNPFSIPGKERNRTTSNVDMKEFKNYFRFKALQELYTEGVIDSIRYVPSLDEVLD